MDEVRELISSKEYAAAIKKAEACLPHLNNPKQTAEVYTYKIVLAKLLYCTALSVSLLICSTN